eukprot:TRINITY_DN2787_c1_g1_i1.p1 TRINITY_DN2787_c1_g1~~TRINITY_DN2787_c1_g1_i1.p1  ORF type:complete len:132 (+),score=0.16 TRINITY_DN2787_c1_g1_i1:56-451(+)
MGSCCERPAAAPCGCCCGAVRRCVSKKKRRLRVEPGEGLKHPADMDMSYLALVPGGAPRLIAMSFPGSGCEAGYRNSYPDARRRRRAAAVASGPSPAGGGARARRGTCGGRQLAVARGSRARGRGWGCRSR